MRKLRAVLKFRGFDLKYLESLNLCSFELGSVVGSYPAEDSSTSNQNWVWVSVRLVHSLLLAKHLSTRKIEICETVLQKQSLNFL